MWRHFLTLRFRLTLLFLAVFGVILTAICLSVLIARERDLWEQFDSRLRDRAAVIIEEISLNESWWTARDATGFPETPENHLRFPGYYIQLRADDESVIEQSRNLGRRVLPLTENGRCAKRAARPVLETVEHEAIEQGAPGPRLRLLTLYRNEPAHRAFFLQVGVSTRPIEHSIRHLRRVFLVTVPAGLLLAGIGAWFMAGRSLAPLSRIAEVAEQLHAENLSLRFAPPGGTDEIASLVTTINRMLDRIAAAFASQERFITDAAHELKTPLTVLLGEAQVLMQQDRTSEEYARFVASVQDEVRALAQTVGSLLTLARAEAGIPMAGLSNVSINEVVTNAVERANPLAKQREVRMVLTLALPEGDEAEPVTFGDESLLSLMVLNLLRNAIRYSPPEEAVQVTVSLTAEHARIAVRDHGPGIPEEYVARVFDRFFRVPDTKGSFQGAGLGLTIARGVAQLHGGAVKVRNNRDGGCEFSVRLPLRRSDSSAGD